MRFHKPSTLACIGLLLLSAFTLLPHRASLASAKLDLRPQEGAVDFMAVEELKSRLAKNQPVTIIDVRATSGLSLSDSKIRGAIYVKLRRLRSRLAYPPLKDVPRDREVVTYCACPNDESSIHAARLLMDAGFKRVRVLRGGWTGWKKAKGPIESMARGL
jgi:rhodanese-related sulfurtransferase